MTAVAVQSLEIEPDRVSAYGMLGGVGTGGENPPATRLNKDCAYNV